MDGSLLFTLLFRPYFQMYGELYLDDYYSEDQACPRFNVPLSLSYFDLQPGREICFTRQAAIVLLVIYLMLSSVVLVNLLVAMMSDKWTDVASEALVIYKRKHYYWVKYHENNQCLPEFVMHNTVRLLQAVAAFVYLPCTMMCGKRNAGGKVAAIPRKRSEQYGHGKNRQQRLRQQQRAQQKKAEHTKMLSVVLQCTHEHLTDPTQLSSGEDEQSMQQQELQLNRETSKELAEKSMAHVAAMMETIKVQYEQLRLERNASNVSSSPTQVISNCGATKSSRSSNVQASVAASGSENLHCNIQAVPLQAEKDGGEGAGVPVDDERQRRIASLLAGGLITRDEHRVLLALIPPGQQPPPQPQLQQPQEETQLVQDPRQPTPQPQQPTPQPQQLQSQPQQPKQVPNTPGASPRKTRGVGYMKHAPR